MSNTINLFSNKCECCGCTACMAICPTNSISMQEDDEGFLYPDIDDKLCIECNKCLQVCAFQNGYDTSMNLDELEVFAVKHKSDEVRIESSSGGVFTAISDHVLSLGGVVYGAAFDDCFRVVHKRAVNKDERNRFRGSKYVQSDIKNIFRQIKDDLHQELNVLFSGTPCQVEGLKQYLAKCRVDTTKLYVLDFLCHGVPSPRIFQEYLQFIEMKNHSNLQHYKFRSKVKGWRHNEEAIYQNGNHDNSSRISQMHKELFHKGLSLRPACYQCIYSNGNRVGDITISDFWGLEKFHPEFIDDLGVSGVIINTSKGKGLFSKILNDVDQIQSNIAEISEKQAHIKTPPVHNPKREAFWSDYYHQSFEYIAKKYTTYGIKNRLITIIHDLVAKLFNSKSGQKLSKIYNELRHSNIRP